MERGKQDKVLRSGLPDLGLREKKGFTQTRSVPLFRTNKMAVSERVGRA
jgi:hypothetical protein